MEKYQVIVVVGSGPVGAACAKALNDEGIEVLVNSYYVRQLC